MRPIYFDNLPLLVNLFRKYPPPSYSSILKIYSRMLKKPFFAARSGKFRWKASETENPSPSGDDTEHR
jgi:hypothetical protein